jgi:hypothetical protein
LRDNVTRGKSVLCVCQTAHTHFWYLSRLLMVDAALSRRRVCYIKVRCLYAQEWLDNVTFRILWRRVALLVQIASVVVEWNIIFFYMFFRSLDDF